MKKQLIVMVALAVSALAVLTGCGGSGGAGVSNGSGNSTSSQPVALRILAGSENKALEPMVKDFAIRQGFNIDITYKGSVDIMLELEKGAASDFDAVWTADRIWITLGDRQHVVKNVDSIYRSPVIMGVKRSVAQRLGWVGKQVTVNDILTATQSGKLRYMMTSATQSNSGASAYLGYLYAFAGKPEVLTAADLKKPDVGDKIRKILGGVNRTAGSSGWLKDIFVQQNDFYDAMVNYESMIIAANQDLVRQGKEPLYAVYPVDGLAIADSPFGFISKGDANKEKTFTALQSFLKDTPQQNQMLALGFRTGLGINVQNADPNVFNPQNGFDTKSTLTPINRPAAEVIKEALVLYQTAFRKPSLTVFVLDFSGSMQGAPEQNLKNAMRVMLDQNIAQQYLLQTSPRDITIVIPFDGKSRGVKMVKGNKEDDLRELLAFVDAQSAGGGTDFYSPLTQILPTIKSLGYENYSTAFVLMTDGESEGSYEAFSNSANSMGLGRVPVYSIMFGDANPKQLKWLAEGSSGKVFDGKTDLVGAFREAKGYNN